MKIERNEHFIKISGSDNNGEFNIEIQNDCSQIRIETDCNDAYIDVNYRELKIIMNTITEVLDKFSKTDL